MFTLYAKFQDSASAIFGLYCTCVLVALFGVSSQQSMKPVTLVGYTVMVLTSRPIGRGYNSLFAVRDWRTFCVVPLPLKYCNLRSAMVWLCPLTPHFMGMDLISDWVTHLQGIVLTL